MSVKRLPKPLKEWDWPVAKKDIVKNKQASKKRILEIGKLKWSANKIIERNSGKIAKD